MIGSCLIPLKPWLHAGIKVTDFRQWDPEQGQLNIKIMGWSNAWLDAGSYISLPKFGQFIATIGKYQGLEVIRLKEAFFTQAKSIMDGARCWFNLCPSIAP